MTHRFGDSTSWITRQWSDPDKSIPMRSGESANKIKGWWFKLDGTIRLI
jgi:hypothetical protein